MKQYKAVFFDWDGTAVASRKAPPDGAAAAMRPLLEKGVKLAVISGTTIENIAGGELGKYFTLKQQESLYLGLGRGAYHYAFREGEPYLFADRLPDKRQLETVHRICFEIHMALKNRYGIDTDIVFSRPNYCKIDLMVSQNRGDHMFMQGDEIGRLSAFLRAHGMDGGLGELMDLARQTGESYGLAVMPTCDAKYLEVGISGKNDNVDAIFGRIASEYGIKPEECAFWGDEYVELEPGIFGSDSFMRTEKTKNADFFDVSDVPGTRPEGVTWLGGGVPAFLGFLDELGKAL